jgi:hypothetical protein
MNAAFNVEVSSDGMLMRLTLTGFLDELTVREFIAARDAAFRKLRCGPNQHLTLCDVSDAALQSQPAIQAFAGLLAQPERRSRRMAIVVRSPLATIQVRRMISNRPDIKLFGSTSEAEGWLLEPDTQKTSASG